MARPRKAATGNRVFIAKENFTTQLADGTPVTVIGGQTRVREGHELYIGREALFEEMTIDFDVEQATAAPGEKRGEDE